jgi:hypothetical protein
VLQRMVGEKLLRGKKGFGGGGRDDDHGPRPKFARSFPSFFRPNIVHRTNPQPPGTPQSPTIIHRTETIFLTELQKSHYRPLDGDLLPSESPGSVHRTDRPSCSRKSRYCPPDGDPLPPAGTVPKSRLLGTVRGTSPKQ